VGPARRQYDVARRGQPLEASIAVDLQHPTEVLEIISAEVTPRDLRCLVNSDLLNKSSFRIPKNPDKREETSSSVIQPVKDCVALLEAFERVGKPRHVDGRLHWEGMRNET
jgi:hypothetical protein